jgi:hypothetical protein
MDENSGPGQFILIFAFFPTLAGSSTPPEWSLREIEEW